MLEAKGQGGSIEFDGTYVTIKHKGVLGTLTVGLVPEKRIPVRNILSVQFKSAGLLNGYIQFATSAGESAGGIQNAVSDENSIIFVKKHQASFLTIKEAIENAIATNQAQPSVGSVSSADEIKKLSELRDAGILTEMEFKAMKAKLL
jgi:hypothetical protein